MRRLATVHGRAIDRRLAEAWDRDVPLRHVELSTKYDVAYYALTQRIAATIDACTRNSGLEILDVGCGLGVLSATLAEQGHRVTGIDISQESIARAHLDFGHCAKFRVENVLRLPHEFFGTFDVVVACMVWHNYPHLDDVVAGCRRALKEGGFLVAAVVEPASYLVKHGLPHRYDVERRFDLPLRHTHCCGTHAPVPYYHRPVSAYVRALQRNHFPDAYVVSNAIESELPENDVITFAGTAAARRLREARQPGRQSRHASLPMHVGAEGASA